jgi:hypothetical protein
MKPWAVVAISFTIAFLFTGWAITIWAYVGRVARYNVLARRLAEARSYTSILEGQLFKVRLMCSAEPAQPVTEAVRLAIIRARSACSKQKPS